MRKSVTILTVFLFSLTLACASYSATLYPTGNVLAAGNYNNSATSSDLTLIIKMTAGNTILIDEGSEVRYLVPTADVNGWTDKSFNDSAWEAGISGVGYADNDDNTVITGPVPSVYTRYHFDAPEVSEVTFLVDFDDFYILWLNGEEVARADAIKNVSPGAAPGFNQLTTAGVTDHESSDTPAGKPNAARWDNARVVKHVVAVQFDNATAVSPKAKLTSTWGTIRSAE